MKAGIAKGFIDLLMLAALFMCIHPSDVLSWGSSHCLTGLFLCTLILIHVWQHWAFVRVVVSKKLYRKNKFNTFIFILSGILFFSIIMMSTGFNGFTIHMHSLFAGLFVFAMLVHFLSKLKSFIFLFRNKNRRMLSRFRN